MKQKYEDEYLRIKRYLQAHNVTEQYVSQGYKIDHNTVIADLPGSGIAIYVFDVEKCLITCKGFFDTNADEEERDEDYDWGCTWNFECQI